MISQALLFRAIRIPPPQFLPTHLPQLQEKKVLTIHACRKERATTCQCPAGPGRVNGHLVRKLHASAKGPRRRAFWSAEHRRCDRGAKAMRVVSEWDGVHPTWPTQPDSDIKALVEERSNSSVHLFL